MTPDRQPHRAAPEGAPRGAFVVLEGLDGAGTTTQTGLVTAALRARGLDVQATAEPSDGPLGAVLRAHLRSEVTLDPVAAALCFTADRADHLARVVRPALDAGTWVVCDRYLLSTLAYQGAEGVDRSLVMAASQTFDVPDLTVVLDVGEEELVRRLSERSRVDRYEARELAGALRESYRTSAELLREHGHRVDAVDGSGTPEEVLHRVLGRLDGAV